MTDAPATPVPSNAPVTDGEDDPLSWSGGFFIASEK
jgi:hypothetical protein